MAVFEPLGVCLESKEAVFWRVLHWVQVAYVVGGPRFLLQRLFVQWQAWQLRITVFCGLLMIFCIHCNRLSLFSWHNILDYQIKYSIGTSCVMVIFLYFLQFLYSAVCRGVSRVSVYLKNIPGIGWVSYKDNFLSPKPSRRHVALHFQYLIYSPNICQHSY